MITERDFIRSVSNTRLDRESAELLCSILKSADGESGTFEYASRDSIDMHPLECIVLRIRDGDKRLSSPLFQSVEVTENGDGTVTARGCLTDWVRDIAESVKEIPPGIYEEGRNSIYTADMCLLLKPYLMKNRRLGALRIEVDLGELREILGTGDKYERLSQFKDKVLKPSLSVISKAYGTNIDYSCVSDRGKAVKSVVFSISDIKPIKIGGKRNE